MKITATSGSLDKISTQVLLIGLFEGEWDERYDAIDAALGGALSTSVKKKTFTGDFLSLKMFTTLNSLSCDCVLLVGLGKPEDVTLDHLRKAMAKAMRSVKANKCTSVATDLHLIQVNGLSLEETSAALSEAAVLGLYSYDKYKSKGKSPKKEVDSLVFVDEDTKAVRLLKSGAEFGHKVALATNYTRDLVNCPPSDMNTQHILAEAKKLSKKYGLKLTVFNKAKLKKLGCGSFLSVNAGSACEPYMIFLEYKKSKSKPTAILGKGITFDSGGLSLKPPKGMEDMKIDMGGSAAVLGTMMAIASLKLPVHVVGVVGTTDNMPGPTATKPGDIVRAYNGKTIEVLNTDAEGRLVLADCLAYTSKNLKPARMIDLATLTGAAVVALGDEASPLMGNDDELVQALAEAGSRSGDKAWPMPLYDDFKDLMKGSISDVKNISGTRMAGSCTAAAFLSNFVGETTWAHLDIAGPAHISRDKVLFGKGATGAGVRLLVEYFKHLKK